MKRAVDPQGLLFGVLVFLVPAWNAIYASGPLEVASASARTKPKSNQYGLDG